MKRKIWLDAERFVLCEVENDGDFDVYTCPKGKGAEVLKAMRDNGLVVTNHNLGLTEFVVNRKKMWFQGELYYLNQCSDIFDWLEDSKVYDFTRYYDRIVFHHPSGRFYAAFIEDTSNYMKI